MGVASVGAMGAAGPRALTFVPPAAPHTNIWFLQMPSL